MVIPDLSEHLISMLGVTNGLTRMMRKYPSLATGCLSQNCQKRNDMENWKEYPPNPDYEASDTGQVRRKNDGKILKQYPQRNGYVSVFLGNVSTPVHRIIATTFLECYWNQQDRVDHVNTVRSDNRASNLRWTDAKGNSNNPITKQNMSKAHRKK